MPDQKLDNLLNLALDATEEEREKSRNLNVGYEKQTRKWEIIVKYSEMGDSVEALLGGPEISVVPLLGRYAIVTLPESMLDEYSRRPQIEFIEKPTRLYFEDLFSKEASCITQVQRNEPGNLRLTGRGVLIGIVDSGVDYRHPAFLTADGKSRILRLWDQSIPGNPPEGYATGTEYTNEEINEALSLSVQEGRRLVPSEDVSGHGTAVLGVAAGSDFSRGAVNRGVAYESDLLVVKMGIPRQDSFPRTTELMQGVDYLVRQAIRLGRPIALNLSFGNNYGSHRGDSLLETYLDNVSGMGKNVICVGMGNNGNDALHTGGKLSPGEIQEIELGVGAFEPTLNVQLWKNYEDEMEIYLEHPAGERVGPLFETLGAQRWQAGNTELLIYYGKPGPFQVTQEIYFDFIPRGTYLTPGVWKIHLRGRRIKEGNYNLWLPGGNVLNTVTGFYRPVASETLTIPSTAAKVITVGAYDSRLNAYADFSGRGGENLSYPKPDLVAPGVDILAPSVGGGYTGVTGTSFATPFVTGAAALMMEWGIVRGNDPFLWGEKVKAYLRRGARPLPGFDRYPNESVGWGEDVIIRLH